MAVLDHLINEVRAGVGGLVVRGPRQGVNISISTAGNQAAAQSYEKHFAAIDPIVPVMQRLPEGSLLTDEMIMPKAQMQRTEFYNDWVRPQHVDSCLTATLVGGRMSAVLALGTPANTGSFKDETLELLRMLLPHLRTAVRTHLQLQGLSLQREEALASLDRLGRAVFFLDASERIVLASQLGQQLLREQDGLLSTGGGLGAAFPADAKALRRLSARAGLAAQPAVGGSLSLKRPSGRRPLSVTVMPLSHEVSGSLLVHDLAVMVFVVTPDR